jgi:hypothetical protein
MPEGYVPGEGGVAATRKCIGWGKHGVTACIV